MATKYLSDDEVFGSSTTYLSEDEVFGRAEPAIPPRERTWGEAITDTGVQLGEGVNTILGAIPNLVAPESGVAQFFNRGSEYWREAQSEPLRQRVTAASQAIDAAGEDGVIAQIVEASKQYFSDPALAARFVATNLPSMIPGIAAAKVAQAATLARGASAAQAASAATTAAGATNAALNAGGARGEAFEDIKRTLIKQGLSEEEATQQALSDSRVSAAVGGLAGFISGKTGLERAIVGRTPGAAGATRAFTGGLVKEAGGEQLEEVSPLLTTNLLAGQYDNRPVTQNLGRTMVETAIGSGPGALLSGGMDALSARRPLETPPAPPPPPGVLAQLDAATQDLAQATTNYLKPSDIVLSTSVDEAADKAAALSAAPLPSPTLDERILAAEAPRLMAQQLEIQRAVDRETRLLEQRDGTPANPAPDRLRLDAQRREEAAGLIESNPRATPDILARAAALRAEAQSLRTRADQIAATSAATAQPAAGTQFEREQLDAQAAVNREMRLPAREAPAAKYADLTPMTPMQARQRLVVMQDQNGQPLSLEITPHPTQKGAFAIARRELPTAADLEIPAPAPAPLSAAEAQNRLESAELGGREQRRKRLDEGRQIVVTRALKNVEERGGVASPQEAQIFQEAGLGRPYDSIDESLGPKPGLVLPQMEERGRATAGGIVTESGSPVQRRDRQARGFGDNASLDFAPTGLQATTSLGAAPDSTVGGVAPTGLVRALDEPAPTGGRTATKQSDIPAVPGLPGVADVTNVNTAGQAGATDTQNQTLLGDQDLGTELGKKRIAEGYQAPKLEKPSNGRVVKSGAKMSTARPTGPGGQGTINDNGTQHTYTVVDPGKLGAPGRMLAQVARIFGKKLVVFESDTMQADGFVLDDDNTSVYLNSKSSVSPLAVFGHEMLHLLKRDNAPAYTALEAVVQRNLDAEGMAKFKSDYGQGATIEELAADLTGNRFQDPDFWTDVFNEIAAQNPEGARGVILKLAAALNKAVNAFKRVVTGEGFKADQYVKDLDAVKAAVKAAVVQYAQQQREPAMRMEAELMRAESQADLTAGSSAPAADSAAAPAKAAPASAEDELAEVEAQSARFSPGRGYDTDAYEGEGRGRAVDTTGARGVPADAGQDRSASGRDGSSAAPSYGTAREGAVSVLARHYSRQPRQSLNGAFFGTGLKGAERDRLASSPDPRIRSRVYFYVDNGKGIRPESGVGGYAHEVQLDNIYDPATRLVPPQANSNSFESAVLNAGFDGYIDRQFTTQQGAVVLLGPKHANVPVRQLGQVAAGAAPAPAVASTLKRGLMSRELSEIDTANIPGAQVRMGNLEIPADQAAAANAELERIGSSVRFSKVRLTPEQRAQKQADEKVGKAVANEQRRGVAVLASAKPGNTIATVTGRKGKDLARLHARAENILRAKPARDLFDGLGIKSYQIVTYNGSWQGEPELSFFITAKDQDGNPLPFEKTRGLGALLGWAMQQDAAITSEAVAEVDENATDIVPAVYFGKADGAELTAAEVQKAFKAFNAIGEDASVTPDGKALKFLYFGDAEGHQDYVKKLRQVAQKAGLKGESIAYNHGVLDSFQEEDENGNVTEGYTRIGRETWDPVLTPGSPGIYERATDSLLVPYILAIRAEGFGFDFARWQQVNRATRQQRVALEQKVAAAEAANRHGLVPRLREKINIARLPQVPLEARITQKTTNANAEDQLGVLDDLLQANPKPLASAPAYLKFEAEAFGSNDVPVAPRNLIDQLQNDGAGIFAQLQRLTPGQIQDATDGFDNGRKFRQLYESGQVPVETTGKLMLWSFLSRGVSPYVQEAMFLDGVRGVEPFVAAAARGDFGPNKQNDFSRWAESIARNNGSASPGNGTTHNLNAFGKSFLTRMSERMPDGRTKLQYLHDLFSDPAKTGKEIRREFVKIGEGVGIDNKVISFTLLVIGHTDVVVLDRVQMKNVFDDGSFANYNLYDGTYQTAIRRRVPPSVSVIDDYGVAVGRQVNQITDDYGNVLDDKLMNKLSTVETFATLEQREGEADSAFDARVQQTIDRVARDEQIPRSDLIDERALKPGSGLASMTTGVRGLMLYEPIEAELQAVLPRVYQRLGRPQDASPGRWHWESWVVTSGQEASHGTLDALLHEVEGRANPFADVTVKQGEYGNTDYGVRYARNARNQQYYLYDDRNGNTYRLTPAAWREWLGEVKQTFPRNFKVTMNADRTDRTAPWFTDSRIDRDAVDAVTRRLGTPSDDAQSATYSRARTNTPEFKRWFGDSKVVDAEGEPLVVYHGAKEDIADGVFRMEKGMLGTGAYFTSNPKEAEFYTQNAVWRTDPNIVAAYVSIKNPYYAKDKWDKGALKAKENGHDGVILIAPDGGIDWAIPFSPTQIKSATGNSGAFDPANPDITKSTRRNIYGQPLLANWTAPTDSKADTALYYLQNKQIDLKRVIEGVTAATGQIDEKWNAYLKEELYHGRTAKATKDFIGDELRPLLTGMQQARVSMADFEEYLHNRHAEERNDQIAKINPAMPDGGSGIDTADARSYLAGLDPAKRQAMEALAQQVDAITKNTRELLVRAGLETRETIDAWEGAYSKYVPLMREDLDFSADMTGTGTGQGYSVKGPSGKRATGSKRDVVDIMANLAMQRERAIVRAEKARVGTALYGLALKNPNPDFWLAVNPDAIKDPQALAQELINMGLDPVDAKAIAEEPREAYPDPRTGLISYRVNARLRSRDNVFAVRINGQDRFLFFNTKDERAKRMVASLKNLDADQLGFVLGGVVAPVTRWFASVNTQYNPIFGAVNLLRDTQGALVNLSTTGIADRKSQVLAGIPGAMAGIYSDLRKDRKGKQAQGQWASLWEEFQKVGGQTGYRDMFSRSEQRAKALEGELKKLTEGKAMQLGRGMFNWLSDYNETLENAVRLSAYKAAKDKGLSAEQAASIAKNLTVNFNRKGQVATQAGALYAFFNAAVQGTTRLAETLSGPAGKKIMAGGLLLGTMQALTLAAMGYDEDEPPEFVKERNLVIPLGDSGKFIQIPMPLGLHVIPSTSRIFTEWFLSGFKKTPQRVASLANLYLEAFNPVGNASTITQTLAPTIADPVVALGENKDWQGRPIYKEDRSGTDQSPGYTRARDTATWISKELSYYLNLASGGTKYKPGVISPTPDQLDYLVAQAGGGVAREIQKISQAAQSAVTGEELPSYKIPVGGRFFGDIKEQSAVQSRFYDNLKRLNDHEREIEGRRKNKEGGIQEYIRDNPEARLVNIADRTEREVQELRRKRREMIEKNRPKESIKMIESQITRKMQVLNDRIEKLEEATAE